MPAHENVWLGKLTALDMTLMGWLGRKTSTQTNKIACKSTISGLYVWTIRPYKNS